MDHVAITDQRGARALSEASTRVDLVSVHVPSNLSREMKACVALRQGLVRSRTILVNGIRGWMRSHLLGPISCHPETFTERSP